MPGTASTNASGTVAALSGVAGLASGGAVYHYHITAAYPYTLGCFGPATLAQCRTLYPTCNTWAPRRYANGCAFPLLQQLLSHSSSASAAVLCAYVSKQPVSPLLQVRLLLR